MESVKCVDDKFTVRFSKTPFDISSSVTHLFTNVSLKKIASKGQGVVLINEVNENRVDVILNGSSLSECQTERRATLNVFSNNNESTFTFGDGGVTSLTSCSCIGGQSGGIYLYMPHITSASQLKWPGDGRNLVFLNCSAEKNGSKRYTGLYITLKDDSLFKGIAEAMMDSFAANFTQGNSLWFIVGQKDKSNIEYDFTSAYFDPPPPGPEYMTRAYVKNGGKGNGIDANSANKEFKIRI
ncbi:uncharacterized protein MONOS_5861 [Monocercomonoides exilis]|uniref:uncharacterized protein n=1 Tax=Monocercomonoides exilis TaxID=2049356 RepID=UPI00355A793C|nr:hypothetical protein MONOS_5861 [Monocercomonoides exilis]|eukprot:MONOS_5861.1-p1 / transcript=MONOS_5861.1 / gene=MONOS_5861 / organism=Monocercomonoides_exilis_PA203 / gene_product=unspecified product / transcript_product=unspecified product / location=Mono_scaffold00176:41366-42085(-) / protein_length=240 / sequence_SO=supercontig / SO=protein_coding / is_pseudo=false